MSFCFWIVFLTKPGFFQFLIESLSPTVTLEKKASSSAKNWATSISPLKKNCESALDTSLPKKRKIEKDSGASSLKLDVELVKNDLDIECVTKIMKLQDLLLDQKLAKEKIQTTGE